jgi:hypothetical protein
MNGIDGSYAGLPRTISYYGEGERKSFAPAGAVPGIGAHEAMNIRAFQRTAGQNDELAADQQLLIKMTWDPSGRRAVVTGGESRATLLKRKEAPASLAELDVKERAAEESGQKNLNDQVRSAARDEKPSSEEAAVEKLRTSREKIRGELQEVERKIREASQDSSAGPGRKERETGAEQMILQAQDLAPPSESRPGERGPARERAETVRGEERPETRKLEARKTELRQKLALLDKVLSKETVKESIKMQQKIMQTLGDAQALTSLMVKLARGMPGEGQQPGEKRSRARPAPVSGNDSSAPDMDINLALAQL